MKKRTVIILCVVAALVAALAAGAVVVVRTNGFGRPYAWHVPVSMMDFFAYARCICRTYAAGDNGEAYDELIDLPCDVHYYEHPWSLKPALTLKAGEQIYVVRGYFLDSRNIGYGLRCWPDYRSGWRYGQPFVSDENGFIDALNYDAPKKYYVKTSELEQVALAFFDENAEMMSAESLYEAPTEREEFAYWVTRYIDLRLDEFGEFSSKDLRKE